MIASKSSRWVRRLCLAIYFVLGAIVLAAAWHFADFKPAEILALPDVVPLTVTNDGITLIAGTRGEGHNVIFPHAVGPLRFMDLSTGKDNQPSLPLADNQETPSNSISDAQLSADGKFLAVARTRQMPEHYFLTTYDLSARTPIIEKTIAYDGSGLEPKMQFSPDSRLLAIETALGSQKCVAVYDLQTGQERYQLPKRISPQFSPDGRLLATREKAIPEQFELCNAIDGRPSRSIKLASDGTTGFSIAKNTPSFSPDGRLVAIDAPGGLIQVFEVSTGRPAFETKGWQPMFLTGGLLLSVRSTGRPTQLSSQFEIPEIVLWNSGDWAEKRAFTYEHGISILSGPALPHPLRLVIENQFALIYETGAANAPPPSHPALAHLLELNVSHGLDLDVIDGLTGHTKTYHLNRSLRWFPYPHAGKLLIPQDEDHLAIWTIPPSRGYRAVWTAVGALAALAVLLSAAVVAVRGISSRMAIRRNQAHSASTSTQHS